jgi:HK97 gp10 family phage protein
MPGINVRVSVHHSKLDDIIARLGPAQSYVAELAADAIATDARRNVPVDTGFLKSTIQKVGSGASWIVTATANYAGYVEFGTRKMAAQPYLRPALESLDWGRVIAAFFDRIGL